MPIVFRDLAIRNTIPTISSVTVGSASAAIPAGGETVTLTGTGFLTGLSLQVASTTVAATLINSTTLTFTSPANSAGSYTISIINTDGTNASKLSAITYFAAPVWSTAATLPGVTVGNSYTTTLEATGGTISYSLSSGSLPTGLSLNANTGVISGTVSTVGNFSFTVGAINQFNQITTRAFTLAVNQITSSPTQVEYVLVGGGGGGGIGTNWGNNAGAGGGGAGGVLIGTMSVQPGVTYSINIGLGGGGARTSGSGISAIVSLQAVDGQNSAISGSGLETITALGGGGGGSYSPTNGITAGRDGGSGGGGGGAGGNQSRAGGRGVYPGSTYLSQARQGYDGGANFPNDSTGAGGGGGGAGSAGFNGQSAQGGQGGIGLVNPFSYNAVSFGELSGGQRYLAGGGGGAHGQNNFQGAGGLGGGGAGKNAAQVAASTGNNGSFGGGGGGLANAGNGSEAGRGGDGIAYIRYPSGFSSAIATPSVMDDDGNFKYYQFAVNGTIRWN